MKTTKKSPIKQSSRPTQQQRDDAKDKSSLTNTERSAIDRQGQLKKNGSAWLLDSKLGGEAYLEIRKKGYGSGDDVMSNAYQKQWLKDSARTVNNRFVDYKNGGSVIKSGDTGQYRSTPYIDQESGDLRFKPNFNLNPPLKMKSPFKMKYGNHK